MGAVHQLILTYGIDGAKASTADKAERRCIDAACAVMSDEEQRIGVMQHGQLSIRAGTRGAAS